MDWARFKVTVRVICAFSGKAAASPRSIGADLALGASINADLNGTAFPTARFCAIEAASGTNNNSNSTDSDLEVLTGLLLTVNLGPKSTTAEQFFDTDVKHGWQIQIP